MKNKIKGNNENISKPFLLCKEVEKISCGASSLIFMTSYISKINRKLIFDLIFFFFHLVLILKETKSYLVLDSMTMEIWALMGQITLTSQREQ